MFVATFSLQIDLKHINQKNDKDNKVEIGIDLREYYPSVEWDILGVPAERHEKYYPCCAEPYPGEFRRVQSCKALLAHLRTRKLYPNSL